MALPIDNPPAGFTVVVEANGTLLITYRPTDLAPRIIAVAFPAVWFTFCGFLTLAIIFGSGDGHTPLPFAAILGLFWAVGLFVCGYFVSAVWCRRGYRIDHCGLEFQRRVLLIRRRTVAPWSYIKEIHCLTTHYRYPDEGGKVEVRFGKKVYSWGSFYRPRFKPPADDSRLWLECGQRFVGRPTSSTHRPPEYWYAKRVTLLYSQSPKIPNWLGQMLATCSGIPFIVGEETSLVSPSD